MRPVLTDVLRQRLGQSEKLCYTFEDSVHPNQE